MDNSTDRIAVTVNVCQKVIKRNYVQDFDASWKTVSRVFAPHTYKEVLAIKALSVVDP
jgi:hypothetical protein